MDIIDDLQNNEPRRRIFNEITIVNFNLKVMGLFLAVNTFADDDGIEKPFAANCFDDVSGQFAQLLPQQNTHFLGIGSKSFLLHDRKGCHSHLKKGGEKLEQTTRLNMQL